MFSEHVFSVVLVVTLVVLLLGFFAVVPAVVCHCWYYLRDS